MPMVPEAVISMLACARIGAVHRFSLIHSLIHSFIHSLTHSLIHSFTLTSYFRKVPPHYQIIIFNRLNTDTVVENITKDMRIEETTDLFVYQSARGEVVGVWFYETTERPQFVSLIKKYELHSFTLHLSPLLISNTIVIIIIIIVIDIVNKEKEDCKKCKLAKQCKEKVLISLLYIE
jgi:hypothetical protein